MVVKKNFRWCTMLVASTNYWIPYLFTPSGVESTWKCTFQSAYLLLKTMRKFSDPNSIFKNFSGFNPICGICSLQLWFLCLSRICVSTYVELISTRTMWNGYGTHALFWFCMWKYFCGSLKQKRQKHLIWGDWWTQIQNIKKQMNKREKMLSPKWMQKLHKCWMLTVLTSLYNFLMCKLFHTSF